MPNSMSTLNTDRVGRLTPGPHNSGRYCRTCGADGYYTCQPSPDPQVPDRPCPDSCELCGGEGIVTCANCDGTGLEPAEEAAS